MHVLRLVGIVVLLWLAWKIATAKRAGPAPSERAHRFMEAAAFQWVNPEGLADVRGCGQRLPSAGRPAPLIQALLFAGVFALAGTPCSTLWLAFGAAMQNVLRSDRALRHLQLGHGPAAGRIRPANLLGGFDDQ
jgi:threonine/homoserine/homoserine lactone efflux protein